MKFLGYCYTIDIDIQDPACRIFTSKNNLIGYVINDRIYLAARGDINLCAVFRNDENRNLTDEYLGSWGENTFAFIRETIGMYINPLLSATWQLTELKLRHCLTPDEQYGQYQDMLQTDSAHQVEVELKYFNDLYFIMINGSPLYKKGITNKRIAKELFDLINNDIQLYLLKRWTTK